MNPYIYVYIEQTAEWTWCVCHGIDDEPVKIVDKIKGFGSSKNLRNVSDRKEVLKHLKIVASEIFVRFLTDREQFNRVPKTLILHYRTKMSNSSKRSSTFMPYVPPQSQLDDKSHEKYVDLIVKVL